VVVHLTERMHDEIESFADRAEHAQPGKAIRVVAENKILPITARSHVVEGAGELESKWSGHSVTVVRDESVRSVEDRGRRWNSE